MLKEELVAEIKKNLGIEDATRDLAISDMIQEVMNYCNLTIVCIELEPFIRKKVQTIINYELENGTTSVFDVKSIKEGDTSITYNENITKETIYGLSSEDKATLRRFRRLR